MNDIANQNNDAAVLSRVTQEVRMYAEAAAMNMLLLGKALTEAKTMVRHGEWQTYVENNAHMSDRQAQYLMRAYARFGNVPAIEGMEKSKIFKMLSLPEGTEGKFIEENNVSEMSARQVEEAVRKVRQEYEERITNAEEAKRKAEQRAFQAEHKPSEIPDSVLETIRGKEEELTRYKGECQRLADVVKDAITEKNKMQSELRENEEMLTTQQQELERVQSELFAAQSTIARGDAERDVSDRLTADEFGRAVRSFIGTVAQMPYMGSRFATMNGAEIADFTEGLSAIEDWCNGARMALNTVEGVIVHD